MMTIYRYYVISSYRHPFFTDENQVLLVAGGGGEEISVASVGQSQAFTQLVGGEREVASGDVGFGDALERLTQLPLVHRGGVDDAHDTPGEVGDVPGGKEKMAVGGDGLQGEPFRQCGEAACFHNGRIGLVEPVCGAYGTCWVYDSCGNKGYLVDAGCGAGVLFRFRVGDEGLSVVCTTDDGVGVAVMRTEPYEQFLAFVGSGHDVYLPHGVRAGIVKAFECLVPVEHG